MSRLWTWVICAFWALAMGLLFREKAMPGLLQSWYPSYESFLVHPPRPGRTQMGIFFAGQVGEKRIGESRTTIEEMIVESKSDPAWIVQTDIRLDLTAVMPNFGATQITTKTLLDSNLRVRTHDIIVGTVLGKFIVNGVVRDEHTLEVLLQNPFRAQPERKEIAFDNAMAISNGLSPFLSTPELRIGKSWSIYQFDPLSVVLGSELKTKPLLATVEKLERIEIEGAEREAFLVRLKGDRTESLIWISAEGEILQERVGFGAKVPLVTRREPWTGPK
jgi:hypothetical protein